MIGEKVCQRTKTEWQQDEMNQNQQRLLLPTSD